MSAWLLANMDALPGVGAELVAQERLVLMQPAQDTDLFPIGGAIDGSNSRDADNPTGRVDIIRDGMPMGRITATNKWAPSIIGQLGKALASTDTNLVLQATAEATELTRRVITVGVGTTFKITGPPSAAGTVRTLTATISSVGAGTGQNAVQTVAWSSVPTAGTFAMTFRKYDGTYVTTAAIAFDSTTVATSINAVLGSSAVTVTYTSTYAYAGFYITYSGTNYTITPQEACTIDNSGLTFTTTVGQTITQTTIGVPAAGTVTLSSALGVNEVQTIAFNIASTGGNVVLEVDKTDGSRIRTTTAAWNATDATYISAIQTVLDTATGVANGIVVSAVTAQDMDLGFKLTYSGTGYAAKSWNLATVTTLPTSSTAWGVTRTTTGYSGAFVVGSLIQPTDGSESIRTLLITGQRTGVSVFNALLQSIDVHYPVILHSGVVRTSYILGYAGNDASTKSYIKAQLRTYGGRYIFDDDFLGTSV